MNLRSVIVLVVVSLGVVIGAESQPKGQFPSFDEVKLQHKQSSGLIKAYRRVKRTCTAQYEDLLRSLEKEIPKPQLAQAKTDLEECYERLAVARSRFEPLALNLFRLENYPNLLLEDGWSDIQIRESMGWIKRFSSTWRELKKVTYKNPTDDQAAALLRKF